MVLLAFPLNTNYCFRNYFLLCRESEEIRLKRGVRRIPGDLYNMRNIFARRNLRVDKTPLCTPANG